MARSRVGFGLIKAADPNELFVGLKLVFLN